MTGTTLTSAIRPLPPSCVCVSPEPPRPPAPDPEIPPQRDPPSREPAKHDPPTEPPDVHDPKPHEIDDPPAPGAPPAIISRTDDDHANH